MISRGFRVNRDDLKTHGPWVIEAEALIHRARFHRFKGMAPWAGDGPIFGNLAEISWGEAAREEICLQKQK